MGLNLIFFYLFLILFSFTPYAKSANVKNTYRDTNLPIEKRIDDLLNRMTLEEKARQMDMYWGHEVTKNGEFSLKKARQEISDLGIGSVHDLYPVRVEIANEIQKYALEQTHLGIPVLMIEEALHGYVGKGSTTFPHSIGLASTWNTGLSEKIGQAIAKETRSHGVHFVLCPVLGIAREPRWGRTDETYGEDPYLRA